MFDFVLLLMAGRLSFRGKPSETVSYFTQPLLGYVFKHDNEDILSPAEFMLKIGNGHIVPRESSKCRTPVELENLFRTSSNYSVPIIDDNEDNIIILDNNSDECATSFMTQFKMLLERSWISIIRNKPDLIINILKSTIIGLVLGGFSFGQMSVDPPFYSNGYPNANVNNVNTLLYFVMFNVMIHNTHTIIPLCQKNFLYKRELAAGVYEPTPYWLVLLIVDLPILLLNYMILINLIYFFSGTSLDFGYYFYFIVLLYITTVLAYYTMIMLSVIFVNVDLVFAVEPFMTMFISTFSGFMMPVNNINKGWLWATYLSYSRYF